MKRTLLKMVAACLLVAGITTLVGCNGATDDALTIGDQGGKGFVHKTLINGTRTRVYAVFIPMNYDPSKKYPMIVFLHGMGEHGEDARANLRVGLAPFVAKQKDYFPFICLFPQTTGDWNENSTAADDCIAAIDQVSKDYSVDQDRISLTGLSTGGYGTWAIGAKYKDRFAALVPMGSSKSDFKDAAKLADIPIRSFHNSGDPFAGSWNDREMVAKIKELGGNAEYTEYSAGGHDCWETAYSDGGLFAWLEEQHRHTPGAAADASMTK